jgi:hypothetical protein
MATNDRVPNEPADKDYQYLQVLGVAKRDGEHLVFRNSLYADVAKRSVQLRPEAAEIGGRAGFVHLQEEAFSFVNDAEYKEIALAAYNGGVDCINSGRYRLALVGFGVTLEAILIDWLGRKQAGELAQGLADAVTTAGRNILNNFEVATDSATWRLVNLVRVARELQGIRGQLEIPDSLREMRNLVHPREMKANYLPEPQLEPEAVTAIGQISTVMRDIQTP